MIRLVKNRMTISTDILNTAYYNFVFGKEAVRVNTNAWISEEDWNGTGKEDEQPVGSVPVEGEGEIGEVPPETDPETPPEPDLNIPPETEPEDPPIDVPPPEDASQTESTTQDGPVIQ